MLKGIVDDSGEQDFKTGDEAILKRELFGVIWSTYLCTYYTDIILTWCPQK